MVGIAPDPGLASDRAIELEIEFTDCTVEARVVRCDPQREWAILALSTGSGDPGWGDLPALPIARRSDGRTYGWILGYSRAQRDCLLPLDSILVLPDATGAGALTVHSHELSVHMEDQRHCLAGAPILVSGQVVGHIANRVVHPAYPDRGLSGFVSACSVESILYLGGIQPGRDVPDRGGLDRDGPDCHGSTSDVPAAPAEFESRAPEPQAGGFDALVTCAIPDRPWAHSLIHRLESQGVRTFLLEPMRPEAIRCGVLDDALTRCRAAVVVMSSHWLDSHGCRAIADALIDRRRGDPTGDRAFQLLVTRIDDGEVPDSWPVDAQWDFRGMPGPAGHKLDALMTTVLRRDAAIPDAPASVLQRAATSATDTMEDELRDAAHVGPIEVMMLWRGWEQAGVLALAPSLHAAETLIAQSRADLALEVLASLGRGIRARQLRALAYARTGKDDDAIKILERLYREHARDSETLGILAGRYKKRWIDSQYHPWLDKAFDLYREAFQRFGDAYAGINAAALALYRGARERSRALAGEVLIILDRLPEGDLDHWQLATYGEAHHLLESMERARHWYNEALKRGTVFHSDVAVMRTQARRNARHLGQEDSVFDDLLTVPRVVAFVGHMEDLPERATQRLPPAMIGSVREAIRDRLRQLEGGFGFSSLARGSDILFVEELLRRRGQATVFLPFPADEFERTSVGPRWRQRYHRLLQNRHVDVRVLAERCPPERDLPDAFDDCTRRVFRAAIEHAEVLDEEPILLAVWDGQPGDGHGGTADAVAHWKQGSHELELIDTRELRRPDSPGNASSPRPDRTLRILFLASSPTDAARLALDREYNAIAAILRGAPGCRRVELVSEWAVRPDTLQEALLRHRPDIVHFAGHGENAALVLEDLTGEQTFVAGAALVELLAVIQGAESRAGGQRTIDLVVCNVCSSTGLARDLVSHVDIAVGMTGRVDDHHATAFTEGFYRALVHGEMSAQSAFDMGVNQLSLHGVGPACAYSLFARPGIDPAGVHLVG